MLLPGDGDNTENRCSQPEPCVCVTLRGTLLRKSKQLFHPNVDFPYLSKSKQPVTLKMSYLNDSMTAKDSEQQVKGKLQTA